MSVENVKIRPMNVLIGDDISQVQKITCVADVEGSLAGKYFIFHEPSGAGHYVWFDDGVADDPEPEGTWTAHPVVYVQEDSASVLAGKITAVLAALTTKFTAVAAGKVITLTCVAKGYAQPARDAVGAGACSFGFKISTLGFLKTSAGNINGDIEVSGFSVTKAEIKTHATGATVQGEIVTGYNKPTIKMSFYDFAKENIKRALILAGGQTITPEGEDAAELIGYGPTNVGGQSPRVKLTLHPCDLDDSDKSEDWTIWAGSFDLDSFKFSGENFSEIPVTVNIYPDTTKPKMLQFLAIGDVAAAGL